MHLKTKHTHHFHGKEALEHLIDARIKGQGASCEVHGKEMPGHVSAFADSVKETVLLLAILQILLTALGLSPAKVHLTLAIFSGSWLLWKTARSSLLGWARLERMHRVIEEERYEIEHHREQEREELTALYQAKGFSGKLLEEVIYILMADDNRLLQVMLEEELGFKLESQEHPLKQASGAAFGVFGSAALMATSYFFLPAWATILTAAGLITFSAAASARIERNHILSSVIWNVGSAALAVGACRLMLQILSL